MLIEWKDLDNIYIKESLYSPGEIRLLVLEEKNNKKLASIEECLLSNSQYFHILTSERVSTAKYIIGLLMGDLRDTWTENAERRLQIILNLLERLDDNTNKEIIEDIDRVKYWIDNLVDFDGRVLRMCNLYKDTFSDCGVSKLSLEDLIFLKNKVYSITLNELVEEEIIKRIQPELMKYNVIITEFYYYGELSKDKVKEIVDSVVSTSNA